MAFFSDSESLAAYDELADKVMEISQMGPEVLLDTVEVFQRAECGEGGVEDVLVQGGGRGDLGGFEAGGGNYRFRGQDQSARFGQNGRGIL